MSQPDSRPGLVTIPAVAHTSLATYLVRIRARLGNGRPATTLTGLPSDTSWTTRDRVRAAILNSGLFWPDGPLELDVFPPLPAADPGLDVPFALAVLAATGQLPPSILTNVVCIGELGLDGQLRPATDLPARLAAAARAGFGHTVVPDTQSADTAGEDPTLAVRAAGSLRELTGALRGQRAPRSSATSPAPSVDLADLPEDGTQTLRRIVEIAAAGGHHLLTIGRTTGATMIAERLPMLLPNLDQATSAQVAALHRQAGILPEDAPILLRAPWQAPHHTTGFAAWAGNTRRPGVIPLAHGGVLFLDDAVEISRRALSTLAYALRGINVDAILRVEAERFYRIDEDQEDSTPIPRHSLFAAHAVLAGLVALPDRAALAAQVAPTDEPEQAAMRAALDRALDRLVERDTPISIRQAGAEALTLALATYSTGQRLTDDDLARLILLLRDFRVRDEAFAQATAGPGCLALWADVTRRAVPELVADPAFLLAVTAYTAAQQPLTWVALERARAADPGHRMTQLMTLAVEAGLPIAELDKLRAETATHTG